MSDKESVSVEVLGKLFGQLSAVGDAAFSGSLQRPLTMLDEFETSLYAICGNDNSLHKAMYFLRIGIMHQWQMANKPDKRSKEYRDTHSVVYFAQNPETGSIKIGTTTGDPEVRVSQIQTGACAKLVLLASVKGSNKEETALHHKFASYRLEGEWFNPSKELMDYIQELGTQDLELRT